MRKLFVYFLWTLLVVTVLAVATAFYAINEGWIGYMPPIEDLQNPISRYATQIYSADGKIIGTAWACDDAGDQANAICCRKKCELICNKPIVF